MAFSASLGSTSLPQFMTSPSPLNGIFTHIILTLCSYKNHLKISFTQFSLLCQVRIILSPEEASRIYEISVFGKRLSRKSDNVVVFPFAFHIAVSYTK